MCETSYTEDQPRSTLESCLGHPRLSLTVDSLSVPSQLNPSVSRSIQVVPRLHRGSSPLQLVLPARAVFHFCFLSVCPRYAASLHKVSNLASAHERLD